MGYYEYDRAIELYNMREWGIALKCSHAMTDDNLGVIMKTNEWGLVLIDQQR